MSMEKLGGLAFFLESECVLQLLKWVYSTKQCSYKGTITTLDKEAFVLCEHSAGKTRLFIYEFN